MYLKYIVNLQRKVNELLVQKIEAKEKVWITKKKVVD